ncbi:mitochondrial ribosomal subunit protein-domain-containing protein [Cercophora newfieldiana]|uniref:Mitochondrial ribosomal subunit protein-domain-containing protein n=1 Tax=Cercophora newfieldiana TaxID=92897 RepID=A0AA40CMK0_9PEZI|nr:mitochondrial ribosomal subunit protein-domain-containing protein [Cercophora newfieldiana]
MATTANSLRLCVRARNQISGLKNAPLQSALTRRALSTTPAKWAEKGTSGDAGDAGPTKFYDTTGDVLKDLAKVSKRQGRAANRMLEKWDQLPAEEVAKLDKLTKEVIQETAAIRRPTKVSKTAFWNEAEPDTDLITDEVGEDDFEENDMTSMAHGKLEEHREYREYARIAVWEMPLLAKFAKPFQPPKSDEVLRFRYTTYMGELHPADKKVVVEFSPADFKDLTDIQRLKLKKLAGARYNPEKDIIKMSCEQFEHQAQNKRYLGDLVKDMITAAKDPTDTFEDIPLDLRHHRVKVKHKFPKEWLLTEERKKELEAERKRAFLIDENKKLSGGLIDGVKRIQELQGSEAVHERVPVPSLMAGQSRKDGRARR